MDDGIRVSADAPFWWTSLPQLHTFTLSSADALWLKGVREGALAVARTPWSDAAGRRTAQLGESQNYFVTMGIQNPDNSCRTLTVDFGESNSTAPMMLLVYLMTQAASSHRSEPGALRWRQSDAHCELLQVGCRLLLTLLTTHGPNPDAHS